MLNKKLKRFLLFVIFLIIIYLIIYLIPKNYEFKYSVDKYDVIEKYSKKDKNYYIKINDNKSDYEFYQLSNYKHSRKIIKNIKKYESNDTICIVINNDIISNNILCKKGDQYIDYHLTEDVLPKKYFSNYKELNKSYKEINIKYLDNHNYYVWNYKGFFAINTEKNDKIEVFKNDIYNISLNYQYKNYLLIVNYDENYNFKKFKLLNFKNNEISEIEYKEDIAYSARFLGAYKNSIYLLDEKNNVEYEINVKKKKVYKIASNKQNGKIYNNGWKNISVEKINKSKISFEDNNKFEYYFNDNGLYLKIDTFKQPIKLSDKSIKTIISSSLDEVFYISEDKLYKYDFKYGEIEILDYFELNFNYENMIFVY